jgi:hypothetical protein
MSKLTHVKWMSAQLPMIILNRNDERLSLTKLELKELRDEITAFMKYYKKDFQEPNINLSGDVWD